VVRGFTDTQFSSGMIAIMEEQPTMQSVLRTLREMMAKEPKDVPDSEPLPMPQEIDRAVKE
jgi:hypothetical protein